jgi:hypothetical protein
MPKPTFPDSDEAFGEFLLQLIFYVPLLLSYVGTLGEDNEWGVFFVLALWQMFLGPIQLISGLSKALRYQSRPHRI